MTFSSDTASHVRQSSDGVLLLFTLGTAGVGFVSYLYLKALGVIQEMREMTRSCLEATNEINENVNDLYLRVDELSDERHESDGDGEEKPAGDHYQAWLGDYSEEGMSANIIITRMNKQSNESNKKWVQWNGERDAATIARDYYFETFESNDWKITQTTDGYHVSTYETTVDGWNDVIRMWVSIIYDGRTNTPTIEEVNQDFQALQQSEEVQWRREWVLSA